MTNVLYAEDSPFNTSQLTARYYQAVASALLPEQSSHTKAIAVCLPSFESEWAFRLHGTERRGYSVTVTEATQPIWPPAAEPVLPPITKHAVDVPREFAEVLVSALSNLLRTVSNLRRAPTGCDGVSYHFSAVDPDYGWVCGRTWSPYHSTATGQLVAVIEELGRYVQTNGADASRLKSIQDGLRRVEVAPVYQCDDKTTMALERLTEEFVKRYVGGIITGDELASQLEDAWDHHGFPSLRSVVRQINGLPTEIRERLLRTRME